MARARSILLRHGQSEWNLAEPVHRLGRRRPQRARRAEAVDGGRDAARGRRRARRAPHVAAEARDPHGGARVARARPLSGSPCGGRGGSTSATTARSKGSTRRRRPSSTARDQVKIWRRVVRDAAAAARRRDARRAGPGSALRRPRRPTSCRQSECLADVVERMLPYWYDDIVPDLEAGESVLVAAHGNSLRALVKHLDGSPTTTIVDLNIPTGIPLVYELDDRAAPYERSAAIWATRSGQGQRGGGRQAGGLSTPPADAWQAMTITDTRTPPRCTSAPTSCRSSPCPTARAQGAPGPRARGPLDRPEHLPGGLRGADAPSHRARLGLHGVGRLEVQGVRLREPRRLVPLRARELGAHAAVRRGRHATCGSTCTAPTSTSMPTATSRASPTARARSQAYYMLLRSGRLPAPERPGRLTVGVSRAPATPVPCVAASRTM